MDSDWGVDNSRFVNLGIESEQVIYQKKAIVVFLRHVLRSLYSETVFVFVVVGLLLLLEL